MQRKATSAVLSCLVLLPILVAAGSIVALPSSEEITYTPLYDIRLEQGLENIDPTSDGVDVTSDDVVMATTYYSCGRTYCPPQTCKCSTKVARC